LGLARAGALVLEPRETDDGVPLPPLCFPPCYYDAERNVAEILVDIALGSSPLSAPATPRVDEDVPEDTFPGDHEDVPGDTFPGDHEDVPEDSFRPAARVIAHEPALSPSAVLSPRPCEPARARWAEVSPPAGLSPGQLAAIAAIRDAGLVVLTGGPGTGKSTVTRAIIDTAIANDTKVLLAAPTGRAAKRLAEATGRRATTIHRLLEIEGGTGEFFHNAHNPLPEALVVIDEASMLDLPLAEALLLALTPRHRLLLVGDADQLPSVGPGNVLRDVIAAADHEGSPIPVVRLTQIFRQAEGSSIVTSAHAILRGRVPESDRHEGGQFYIVHARDSERAHELVLKAVLERIPRAYGLDPRTEIQVLCPMHKGKAGTEALNAALQAHHTQGAPELVLPGRPPRIFRVGDRVMQIKNDHERGVFNGDIGLVTAVDPERQTLTVEIDGAPVSYDQKQLGALQLAYAVSIHKSQGSEFPAVVVPLLGEHHVMLRRNLLYTAVTRARRLCVLVADPRAITQAVHRGDAARRFTGLRERLLSTLRARLGEARTIRYIDGA
ncbi:MAG TPA: AAA family ATPase, partial [Nannocystis sp.]